MKFKYKIVIEVETSELLSDSEKGELVDAMSVQSESLSDGDIANMNSCVLSATIEELG